MMSDFRVVLEAAAGDPDRSLAGVPLLVGEERRRVLVEWNSTEAPIDGRAVHEVVEGWARVRPDAVAGGGGGVGGGFWGVDWRGGRLAASVCVVCVGRGGLWG